MPHAVSNQSVVEAASGDAPFLNLFDPEYDSESAEVAAAREQSWYATTPIGLLVLRHQEADDILRDRRFHLAGEHYMEKLGVRDGPLYDMWMNSMMSASVADHARLRGLVNKPFAPRMVERFRPFIHETANRLADEVSRQGECEFVAAFADPLPALVMCEMLGVPATDYDRFHDCSYDIALAFSNTIDAVRGRVEAAIVELSEYVESLLAERREQPGDDLISLLIAAEEAGDRLTSAELENLVLQLVWSGQDTTSHQLGRAMVAFAEHPDQWEALAEQPELAPQAVEEVCRWSPQARTTMRYAVEDLEYQGLEIKAGTMVLLSTVTANRDPRAFDDPERFDVTIPRRARQLVFGGGIHNCLGMHAARIEMAEGLRALTQRCGPPSITGEVKWRPRDSMIHGPDVLPLRFERRR
jgi:cytochrome P450